MTGALPSRPFARLGPSSASSPLVCAVPHAGHDYPAGLLAAAACPPAVLEELEDRHADRLIDTAVAAGAVAIVAQVARAWIDLNRGPADLAPDLRGPDGALVPVSARARSGLGLIPTRIGRRELWRHRPDPADVATRIATVHAPYHAAIAAALAAARATFGVAVLLDCHSMPPLRGGRGPRLVIGDRHGSSAAPQLGRALLAAAGRSGIEAALNAPYAGAYSLDRHGRPAEGIHAVQIEIDRSLYLQPDLRALGPGVARMRGLIAELAATALAVVAPLAEAAE